VAVALARLGVPARLLARIADDMLGRRIREHLTRNGVQLDHAVTATEQTSLAMVAVGPDGGASYDFRVTGTADWQWTPDELEGALDGPVVALHSGSLALTTPPGAAVLRDLIARAAASVTISYDPNCRPLLMGEPARVLEGVHELLAVADVVKVSAEDLEWLLPGRSPEELVDDWLARGPAIVAVTLGGDGVLAGTASGIRTRRPGVPVTVVDTVGAGDTFSAALLAGLHRRGLLGAAARPALRAVDAETFDALLDEAARAAAITCSRRGADPPTAADLARA
jgi:fructokinase